MKKKRIVRTIQRIVALLLLFSMFPVTNYALAEDAVTGSTAGGTKTVTDNGDGTYQVQLTLNGAYVEEQTVTPTDFIFVCDVSGSMKDSISSSDATTRFTALINALNSAVDIIFKDEDTSTPGTQNQNRVSFITFSSIGSWPYDYTDYQKVYPSIGDGYYDSLSNAKSAIATINNTGALGGTNYCLGLDKAGQKAAESDTDRNVVMIFLTDGQVSNYLRMNYGYYGWYWGESGTGQPDSSNLADCIAGTNDYVKGCTYTDYVGWTKIETHWDGWNPKYSKYFDARYCVALGFDPNSISDDLSSCITNFCPDGIKKADSEKELESIFNTIATNPFPMRNVSIQDTLTSDVDFTTTDTSGFTVQVENGSYDENNNLVWGGNPSTIDPDQINSLTVSNNTVSLIMKPDSDAGSGFTLSDTQRLILSFNIKPSDSVYSKVFEDPTTTTFNTNVVDTDTSNPNSSYGAGNWGEDRIYAVYPSGTIKIPTMELTLKKIEIGNPDNVLSGATFKIERQNGDSWTSGLEVETNDQGEIAFSGLPEGSYRITETAAPSGYIKLENPISFNVEYVNGNHQITNVVGAQLDGSVLTVSNEHAPIKLTIKKLIKGSAANQADTFSFTVKDSLAGGDGTTFDLTADGSQEIEANYKSDITITENDLKGYTATATIGEGENAKNLTVTNGSVKLENVTEDTLIVFTNTKNAPVVTGFVTDASGTSGIALVSITMISLGALLIYLKKRHF